MLVACKRSEFLEVAFLGDIEVTPGMLTDVGAVVVEPISKEREDELFSKWPERP